MSIEKIIASENVILSNGGLAFHYGRSAGNVNRSWKPSTKGVSGLVNITRNGITMVLPETALTKKGAIKKSWLALLDKMAPEVTLEDAIALNEKGVELMVA